MKTIILCLSILISGSVYGAVSDESNLLNHDHYPLVLKPSERVHHVNDNEEDLSPFGRDVYHFEFKRIYDRVPASVEDYFPQDDFRNLIRNCWYRCRFN